MQAESYLEIVKNLAGQLEEASSFEVSKLPVGHFNKIVVSGMGGSSIVGGILRAYLHEKCKIPLFLSRGYSLPAFVDRNTLIFSISYSGNTEETLNMLKHAFRKGAALVGVTSGGKLLQKFIEQNLPYIKIPGGLQPRATLAYQIVPILKVLNKLNIIPDSSSDIKKTVAALKNTKYEESAKSLAGKLIGKIPLIYASDQFFSVAYRWKTQFNENSKIHAFTHYFPELNHNELVGFTNINANYHIIMLEDESDHPRIKARMRLTREMISKKDVPTTHIVIKGDNVLTRLFSAIHIGDLTTVYLALFTNTDPEQVELLTTLKERLGKVPHL
ncbi:bifunctional phosphoglucose/phosphomannose isomerase [Candidatus Woesearchaeota archaeon]|nr:bifunctional phosphoglucose/phosphomannose isomerase [Candidatus Woesearchaeota archaeon]|tara:strand:+ start:39318 stop:40307 length:990 start_codon:yes stop_codon:yes gene_type:complete